MKRSILPAALVLALPLATAAAPRETRYIDHSNSALIDRATAKAVMAQNVPARLWRVYPPSRYIFASQVEGGMNASNICVVTARVMLLPLTPTAKAVLFRPHKTATAYDTLPSASGEQCKALARDKLKEATVAVVSALVKG